MDADHLFVPDSTNNSASAQQEPGVLNSVLQHAIQRQLGINLSQESAALGRLGSHVLQGAAALPSQATADAEAGTGAAAAAGAAETAAAEAQRHRLANSQTLDLQAVAKWVEGMLPFILILAAVFVYHFCTGIFLFLWLLCSLVKANQLMRKVAGKQRHSSSNSSSSAGELVAGLLYIATNIALVGWLTAGQRLYRSFLLQPPESPISVWQATFLVLVADSMVRFCGLAPKLLLVAAAQSLWRSRGSSGGSSGGSSSRSSRSSRRQARLLTLLEYLLTVYRALVPIPVWYTYLLTCTLNGVLSSLLAGFYLTFKGWGLLRQGQLLLVATKLLLRSTSGALVGTYLGGAEGGGEEQLMCCPICQEPADAAVRLDCSHIFCEECISEWLSRDKAATCPMCRAQIQPPGLECFGDGATSLLPQLF